MAISASPSSPKLLYIRRINANNFTTCLLFCLPISRRPNTVLAWLEAFSSCPGRGVSAGRWMRRAPFRVLVIVDWPLSIRVLGRSRGVSGILRVADAKDKLVRVHAVVL